MYIFSTSRHSHAAFTLHAGSRCVWFRHRVRSAAESAVSLNQRQLPAISPSSPSNPWHGGHLRSPGVALPSGIFFIRVLGAAALFARTILFFIVALGGSLICQEKPARDDSSPDGVGSAFARAPARRARAHSPRHSLAVVSHRIRRCSNCATGGIRRRGRVAHRGAESHRAGRRRKVRRRGVVSHDLRGGPRGGRMPPRVCNAECTHVCITRAL